MLAQWLALILGLNLPPRWEWIWIVVCLLVLQRVSGFAHLDILDGLLCQVVLSYIDIRRVLTHWVLRCKISLYVGSNCTDLTLCIRKAFPSVCQSKRLHSRMQQLVKTSTWDLSGAQWIYTYLGMYLGSSYAVAPAQKSMKCVVGSNWKKETTPESPECYSKENTTQF